MPDHEYRVVPAPDRPAKSRAKGGDPFAETFAAVLNTEARAGWEFVRAETLPCRERAGLTGTRTGFRTLLVFRRLAAPEDDAATREALKLLENRQDGPVIPQP